ncbi:MAG: NYN domain-containing protein [Planctomycetes bacterium]|nr:NYN domain-containing protein [Planctomycetota bacterium]
MSPSYIIDGYNLIHALGMIQKNEPAGGLEDSRRRLLSFLAGVFAGQTSRVIVVFDAQDAPPGATRQLHFQGLKVHFAPKHLTADDWIEKLIADEKQPRGLVVISNDHRLQIAARQRGARAWPHDALLDFAESRNAPPIASAAGPEGDGSYDLRNS